GMGEAVFVANTWNADVTIVVERGGTTYDVSRFGFRPTGSGTTLSYAPLSSGNVPIGEAAMLLFATSCPHCPAADPPPVPPDQEQGIVDSVHMTTSAPVVMYFVRPYGGGDSAVTGARLLIPTSAWGDNYVASTGARDNLLQPHLLRILAQED